jgi:hypothetical protein
MGILGFLSVGVFLQISLPAEPVTFSRDIAPILFRHCASCHRPDQIAPFSLLRFEDASKRSKQIVEQVKQGNMPPWKPVAGHGDFLDERRLTPEQIRLLETWAESGAPQGDPQTLPLTPKFREGFQLGVPDMVFEMSEAFTVPAEGADISMNFVFPLNLKKETYLRAVEILPGNRRVAHHALGILDVSGAARKRADAKGKDKGYAAFGTAGWLPAGFTAGYIAGAPPRFFDSDSSLVLKPGMDFVLQVRYHPSGKVETDKTRIGLYVTELKPPRECINLLLGSETIDLPPGEKAHKQTDEFILPADFEIRSIRPHMHLIGNKLTAEAELPTGVKLPLLRIDDWDFPWQETYHFAKPVRLPKGSKIRAEFLFDNSVGNPHNPSNPPKRVAFGETVADEMGELWIGGVATQPADEAALSQSVFDHFLEIRRKGIKK